MEGISYDRVYIGHNGESNRKPGELQKRQLLGSALCGEDVAFCGQLSHNKALPVKTCRAFLPILGVHLMIGRSLSVAALLFLIAPYTQLKAGDLYNEVPAATDAMVLPKPADVQTLT